MRTYFAHQMITECIKFHGITRAFWERLDKEKQLRLCASFGQGKKVEGAI